ncbi:DUF6123 family protein [Niallia nealsonii]|uniref:Uncharacterized protein n=1 Tax=Niallia nealsonii TaxID=115979 RepID=A0A2N0Z3I0_9BACI|nr:DUF6123 family protein [Niallia nealsonii]PKG24068.1 hypothetical protein CWS01_08330 [Niallia nealsonii]
MSTLDDYLLFLQSKGFFFKEDTIGFIYFGKALTNAPDELSMAAIECTLKIQKSFDGSFYVSLLEMFVNNNVKTKRQAFHFIRNNELFPL